MVSDRRYGRGALVAVGEGAIALTQSAELAWFQKRLDDLEEFEFSSKQ